MKCQEINIATARIEGLTEQPRYFDHRCYYVWSITFSKTSTLKFNHLPLIRVGETEEEGKKICNQFKENFKEAHIHEGDMVAVLFGNDNSVIAIGKLGEDLWVDATDNFVNKTFGELNIVITSLKVH